MKKGHDVEVIAIRDKSMLNKNLISELTEDMKIHNLFLKRFSWRKQLSDLISGLKPFDVFDVHNTQFTLPIKGKIILSLHFFELTCPRKDWPRPCEYSLSKCLRCVDPIRYFHWKRIRDIALKKSDRVMVKYKSLKDLLIKSGIPSRKIFTVPHWIDVDRINRLSKKKVNIDGINKDDFVFAFFGRASHEKGPFLLLEAFAQLAREHEDIKLMFLGNPFVREKIENFCDKRGIPDKVFLLGAKPHNVVHRFLSAADCIVFPNRYFNYEWGLLEAMCVNKPIVATDVFATREILDEKNAVLVDVSPEAVMSGMEQIMNERAKARKMAARALATVRKKHGMGNLKLYEKLLENFR
jgi:glycosyltransferase involved in cell wall biosynthesis